MSSSSDPAPSTARTLRRLGHLPVVPTTYASRDVATESMEALYAASTGQGYEDGYAAGHAEALELARRKMDEESQRAASAVSALRDAVVALREAEAVARAELHAAAPGLAFALLEALLEREAKLTTDPVREAIARALALDESTRPVTIRLNPTDVGALDGLSLARDVAVIPDPGVERGGALVEIDDAVLDGQLGTALERVRQVLLGPAAPGAGR